MLSMAANLHRLEFLKGNISLLAFERTAPHHLLFTIICNAVYESSKPVLLKDAFALPQVRKLYEMTASCLKHSKSESNDDNSSLPPTPQPVLRKRSPSASCESNGSGSMPPTPPPADTKQSDASEGHTDDAAEGMDASTPAKSPEAKKNCMKVTPKKRKLRFTGCCILLVCCSLISLQFLHT
uniref:Uncharacterized protein n=1 Tax=Ascaris lumbricoides TaxID=6252 RepID=A0A0M3IU81_ASCLU